MPIGLKRGTVKLVPHDPSWKDDYEKEVHRLQCILPESIGPYEHFGSTAISTIPAKPIIDFMAGVDSLEEAYGLKDLLTQNGYHHRPNGDNSERVLFVLGPESCRTHHFSLVLRESRQWIRAVGFRDLLRSHRELGERYAKLKERLSSEFPDERALYTEGKEFFFEEVFDLMAWEVEN